MSTTEQNLYQLLTAIKILKDLPAKKLAENKILVQEIQEVLAGKNVARITDGMWRDFQIEQNAAMNSAQKQTSKMSPDSAEFLSLYAKFRGAAHNILEEKGGLNGKAEVAFTTPVKMQSAAAFNAEKKNPFASQDILNTSEAKEFERAFKLVDFAGEAKKIGAFNSIFSDHALQIRTPNDPTTISSFIDYSPYIWNYIYYLSIPTLAQTIDLSIQIATRQVPEITFQDDELKKALVKVFKRTRFVEKLQKMLLYSHLSPRGALIVPIQDEDGTIRFNVFNDTQFTYATSYQYSRIDFRENLTGVSSLYVLGHMLQNEVTAHFLCPGFEPLYAIGKNRIFQLKDAAEAVNIYLYTIKVLCIRAQVLVQTWGGEGQNDTLLRQMQNTTDDINSKLSLNTAVKLPESAKLDILKDNFSEGFSKVSPIIKEYQGMLSGVMPDYFYGSDTAYAANSFNIHATHQNIRSQIQEGQIEPIYRFVINKMLEMDARFAKWKDQRDDFDIEFESLYEPTEVERVDVDTKKINNIVTMAGYPELAQIFKDEGLLNEEYEVPKIEKPANEEGDDEAEGQAVNNSLIQTIDPKQVQPLHEVRYEPKLMRLVKLMDENGWVGEPLLVIERALGTYRGVTGTHRLQAAEIQGIQVPVVVLPSNQITELLTTGKDKQRLKIIEQQSFETAVINPDLAKLAREIMRAEVTKNEAGW